MHPNNCVGVVAYEADYAATWGRKCRDLLAEYGDEVFGVQVDPSSRAADRWDILGRKDSFKTAGIGGPIMGRGFNLLIIDDPIKNAEEAMSATILQKHWDWFVSTAENRLEPGASIVVIMHRWHSLDLIGRIKSKFKEIGKPVVDFRLPGLAEADDPLGRQEGQALWPQRYNVEKLEQKRALNPFWFAALYQGRPVPMGGALFKSEWFNRKFDWITEAGPGFEGLIVRETGQRYMHGRIRRIMVVDPSLGGKGSDKCSIGIYGLSDDNKRCFVLFSVSERVPVEDIVPRLDRLARAWKVDVCLMEANGFQVMLAKSARDKLPCQVREIDPQGKSKVVRATNALELACAGDLLTPDASSSPWLTDWMTEHCEWSGQDGDIDDQCDCTSYACIELRSRDRNTSREGPTSGKTKAGWNGWAPRR